MSEAYRLTRKDGAPGADVVKDYEADLLPDMPPFISRVRSGYAPLWGGLQTRLG